MRGEDEQTGALLSELSPEAMVPAVHPLRLIRPVVNAALERLRRSSPSLTLRSGVPRSRRRSCYARLLQAIYGVRSERQVMEQVGHNMLFRWFIERSMGAAVWDVTVFTKEPRSAAGRRYCAKSAAGADPTVKPLLSNENFSLEGSMIDTWSSIKSFQPKDGSGPPPSRGRNGDRDFYRQAHSNDTHASTTDPDARLYRKSSGQPARQYYLGKVLMENRNGLLADAELTRARGWAERAAAEAMIEIVAPAGGVTLGADRAYDKAEHVSNLRTIEVTPHVAQNTNGRRSAIDDRTTRHKG
jgi:hypothetical protein